MIIPSTFGQNPASILERSFEAIVDDGHLTITIAHHEPKAQVS